MSIPHIRGLWESVDSPEYRSLSAAQAAVLLIVAESADDETGRCWPAIETICKRTRLSRSSVIRALQELEGKWIGVERRQRDDGGQSSNRYVLLFSPVYSSSSRRSSRLRRYGGECQGDTGGGVTVTREGGITVIPPIEPPYRNPHIESSLSLSPLTANETPVRPSTRSASREKSEGARLTREWNPKPGTVTEVVRLFEGTPLEVALFWQNFYDYWISRDRDAKRRDWDATALVRARAEVQAWKNRVAMRPKVG